MVKKHDKRKSPYLFPLTKERLMQYRGLLLEIENQKERVMRIQSGIEYPPSKLDGLPRGHGAGANDKYANAVHTKTELEQRIAGDIEKRNMEAAAIESGIQLLDNPYEREILRLRYLEARPWLDICEIVGYESSNVFRIHANALRGIHQKTDPWPVKGWSTWE